MTESFYDLLGVSADADVDEIQRAYRRRIKETHPDVNDDPDASERTARLVEARDVLTDEEERARYDRIGHDAYVDADSGPGSWSSEAADTVGSSSSNDGPTNARAGAEERRRRERRARRDVDFGDGSENGGAADATATSSSGTARSTGDSTSSTASATANASATADGASAGFGDTGNGATASATRGPPPWNDANQGWAARSPTSPPPGLLAQTKAALLQAPATAITVFVLYPLLVFGTFLPDFPLAVNLVVCVCLVATIAAAQSVAGLGVAIFGTWTAVGTAGLVAVGVSPFSPVGLVVLGTTWLPLGFSVLTYHVLDT